MKIKSLQNWQGNACVIGVDWGDSGKGRLIDNLAQRANVVARYNGGSNTGHTVVNNHGNFALHIVPSGIFNQDAVCLIGRGVACDLESLIDDEFVQLTKAKVSIKNLFIDPQATLTMPWHKLRDGMHEEKRKVKIGTTRKGVGPTIADRVQRVGLQVKDLISPVFRQKLIEEMKTQNSIYNLTLDATQVYNKYKKYAEIIKPHVKSTIEYVSQARQKRKNILFEGAQGWLLDIDSGTYPFVTSSNPGVIGVARSYDFHPSDLDYVIGITKAYFTRVGEGPMPTKLSGKLAETIIDKGHEVGTTSGRVRDPGWLDLVAVKAACEANKVSHLALTKLDILSGFKKINVCTKYTFNNKEVTYPSGDGQTLAKCKPMYEELLGWTENIEGARDISDLPTNANAFVKKIEEVTKTPISFVSVGPKREEMFYV